MRPSIEASGLGRRYRHGLVQSGPLTWRKLLSNRFPRRGLQPLWALRDVSFTLDPGHSLGLVGPNGAGKSTLLQLMGGIGMPDKGTIEVQGRVSALFELGQDFHPDLTGRDNAITAGVIAGFTRKEMQKRLDGVIDFADLGRFIDSPLRIYSSGMKARLAFAVAINTEPDVMLIDEVLAVGDIGFQRRCRERIKDLRAAGVTIVVASHSVEEVRALCDVVLWLRAGRVIASGTPGEVLERFEEMTASQTRLMTPAHGEEAVTPNGVLLELHTNRFGTLEATIDSVRLIGPYGSDCSALPMGSSLQIEFLASVPQQLQPAAISVKLIRRQDGLVCLDTSTAAVSETETIRATADIERLDLSPGPYAFDVGLFSESWDTTYDFHKGAYELQITGKGPSGAVWAPPVGWTVRGPSSDRGADSRPHRRARPEPE